MVIWKSSELLLSSSERPVKERLYNNNNNEGINRLTPNDPYMDRTAPLTSKRYIIYIYLFNKYMY